MGWKGRCMLIKNKGGFTLTELLVAMGMAAIFAAAMFRTFSAQQIVFTGQEEVVATQQNMRAALDVMVKTIRMAGYNPSSSIPRVFGFVNMPTSGSPGYGRFTSSTGIAFYIDANDDGVLDSDNSEQIAFRLNVDSTTGNQLATPDNILRRYTITGGAGSWEPLAENVQAIGFAYALDSNSDGQLDRDTALGATIWAIDSSSPPDGQLDLNLNTNGDEEVNENDNASGSALGSTAGIESIRAVKIWILARSQHQDKGYTDKKTYAVANQRITPNDGYRRRLLTTTVKCRNMGL